MKLKMNNKQVVQNEIVDVTKSFKARAWIDGAVTHTHKKKIPFLYDNFIVA